MFLSRQPIDISSNIGYTGGIYWYTPQDRTETFMYLDKQHPVPIYLQLKNLLQNQIEQGIYLAHQQLPSERDLCKHHNLSRMTARRALQELIDEGLAYTKIGKGTFVSDKIVAENGASSNPKNAVSNYYEQTLTQQLLRFDCGGVDQTISEALATISSEVLALEIFPKLIKEFEERWQKGEISLLTQRYATTTLHTYLVAMMNAATPPAYGPRILLTRAAEDQHEIGLLLLALGLKRRGFRVTYLGQNSTISEFREVIQQIQPQLICTTAGTRHSAASLTEASQALKEDVLVIGNDQKADKDRPLFAFGGVAFAQEPALVTEVQGIYLGQTIAVALTKVQQIFGT